MGTFLEFHKRLHETPKLHDEELPYGDLTTISVKGLDRSHELFGILPNDIRVYKKLDSIGFVAGRVDDNEFQIFLRINCRKVAYPVVPKLIGEYLQVSMVLIDGRFAEEGITKAVYELIASRIALVSDHEQYLGAKGLWKSLARSSRIAVTIFDGNNGTYTPYNSTNINDKKIWGDTIGHTAILLIAHKGDLK